MKNVNEALQKLNQQVDEVIENKGVSDDFVQTMYLIKSASNFLKEFKKDYTEEEISVFMEKGLDEINELILSKNSSSATTFDEKNIDGLAFIRFLLSTLKHEDL
ncbi:MAG: hypothetical protein N4A71_00625 [Carboxylicivirga sp.]|jgi:galactitol-specific phosphotransferase system IIB component|nr:hypothetical protein [Carboxylicivirga sp.]MCT4646602.1 hypothetical protein [Carboxylicivirga sp.]